MEKTWNHRGAYLQAGSEQGGYIFVQAKDILVSFPQLGAQLYPTGIMDEATVDAAANMSQELPPIISGYVAGTAQNAALARGGIQSPLDGEFDAHGIRQLGGGLVVTQVEGGKQGYMVSKEFYSNYIESYQKEGVHQIANAGHEISREVATVNGDIVAEGAENIKDEGSEISKQCWGDSWSFMSQFVIKETVEFIQGMVLALGLATQWTTGLLDFFEGIKYINFTLEDDIYWILLIICITVVLGLALLILLEVSTECQIVECCGGGEEFLWGVIVEQVLVGYLCFPLLSVFLNSMNCEDKDGDSVMVKYNDKKCGEASQISVAILSAICIFCLLCGVLYRNLINQSEHKHGTVKKYKWKMKTYILLLLFKYTIFRLLICSLAVFGKEDNIWPPVTCCIICAGVAIYYFVRLPYVNGSYNAFKCTFVSMLSWAFFVSFITNAADSDENVGCSIVFFLFFLIGPLIYYLTKKRSEKHPYQDNIAERHFYDNLPTESKNIVLELYKYQDMLKWKDFDISAIEQIQNSSTRPVYDLEFKAETTEGFIHLIKSLLFMLKEQNLFPRTLKIVGSVGKTANQKSKLTEECFNLLKLYLFGGGFMFMKEFELNGYRAGFPHQIICKFILLLGNNPILEILRLTDLNIDAECGHKIVKIVGRNRKLNHLMADFVLAVSKQHLKDLDIEIE